MGVLSRPLMPGEKMWIAARVRRRGPIAWFRWFRYTRPFWGGVLVLIAGLEIAFWPLSPVDDLVRAGKGVWAGLAVAAVLLLMGAVILLLPSQRHAASVIAAIASVASFPLSNLGGWVVGMLLGILGSALAFGWSPDAKAVKPKFRPGYPVEPPPAPSSAPSSAPPGADEPAVEDEWERTVLTRPRPGGFFDHFTSGDDEPR